jgi:HSP20 family protein
MTTIIKNPDGNLKNQSSWYNPLDRFFKNDFINLWSINSSATIPSINIKEQNDHYQIEMAAPGLKKEDFNIGVEENILTISCEKESGSKEGDNINTNFFRREFSYSHFSRSMTLPENADIKRIVAKYIAGILSLNIPKKSDMRNNDSQKINVG